MVEFEKWLLTEEGKRIVYSMRSIPLPYSKNILWWTFKAGTDFNPQFKNMQSALMKAYQEVGERRKQVKYLEKEIIKLRDQLNRKKELQLMG